MLHVSGRCRTELPTSAVNMLLATSVLFFLIKESEDEIKLNTETPLSRSRRLPMCKAAMGGAKLIIAKHVACHVTNHSPDSRKENMLSLLAGLGKGYCRILLPQTRPEGKVLSSHFAYCAHTTRTANVPVA